MPGCFRTRVMTEGVTPSLHIDYKHSKIKQYDKEGRALRTETTINNTRDFDIGKRLKNLPLLREVGFAANRRLLNVQQVSHDCHIGSAVFQQLQKPVTVDGQRASAIRFGKESHQALLQALLVLSIVSQGFKQKELKERFAQLLGLEPSRMTQGKALPARERAAISRHKFWYRTGQSSTRQLSLDIYVFEEFFRSSRVIVVVAIGTSSAGTVLCR